MNLQSLPNYLCLPVLFLWFSLLSDAAAQESKFCCVDLCKVFDSYWKTQKEKAEFEEHKADFTKKMKSLSMEMDKKREELRKLEESGSPAFESKRAEYQLFKQDANQQHDKAFKSLGEEFENKKKTLTDEIVNVLQDSAKKGGFTVIIDKSNNAIYVKNPGPPPVKNASDFTKEIIEGAPDLTSEIIKILNAGRPSEEGQKNIENSKVGDKPGLPSILRNGGYTQKVYTGIGEGHWLKENIEHGVYILLEDGSLWQVNPLDRIDAQLWLRQSSITVIESNDGTPGYDYLLINSDDKEEVHGRYIGR